MSETAKWAQDTIEKYKDGFSVDMVLSEMGLYDDLDKLSFSQLKERIALTERRRQGLQRIIMYGIITGKLSERYQAICDHCRERLPIYFEPDQELPNKVHCRCREDEVTYTYDTVYYRPQPKTGQQPVKKKKA